LQAQPSLPSTLQHLGRATSLTSLTLGAAPKEWSAIAADVAGALQQLTRLQRLIITFGIFSSGGDAGTRVQRQAVQVRMATLMAAMAGLPRLSSLQLHQLPGSFAGEAARQLRLATQLTELQLLGGLSSSALLSIIESLPQLRSLTICSNPDCSNKVVGAIARHLQRLTMLDLSMCGASHRCRRAEVVLPTAIAARGGGWHQGGWGRPHLGCASQVGLDATKVMTAVGASNGLGCSLSMGSCWCTQDCLL